MRHLIGIWAFVIVALILSGVAHADAQWWQATVYVKTPYVYRKHFETRICASSKARAKKEFVSWATYQLASCKQDADGQECQVTGAFLNPTHEACVP